MKGTGLIMGKMHGTTLENRFVRITTAGGTDSVKDLGLRQKLITSKQKLDINI